MTDAVAEPVVEDHKPKAEAGPKFSVGIDLGTTHCVLSYAEINLPETEEFSQQVMLISQLTAPGAVEERTQLPSFLYQAHSAELAEGSTA